MKSRLRQLLVQADHQAIVDLAGQNRRVLSFLTGLTYDPDPLICWRAIEALGHAAGHIAENDTEFVRNHVLRLLWLLNDESGGVGWRAPEAIGEIVRAQPDRLSQFWPIVASLMDMMEAEDAGPFRPGMLWAIGRLGQVRPEAVLSALPWIIPCLDDANPQTRGIAAWCLGQLGATAPLAARPALLDDETPVTLYSGSRLVQSSVARLVAQALA